MMKVDEFVDKATGLILVLFLTATFLAFVTLIIWAVVSTTTGHPSICQ